MPHSNDVGFQLHNLSNLMRQYAEQSKLNRCLNDNVSRNNLWILGYLAHNADRDVFQKDLENCFCVRRSTVSKVIRLMEDKGFIRREDVDYDARLKKIVLTDAGHSLHYLMEEDRKTTENLLRQGVTDEELTIFFSVMEKFKQNLTNTF